MNDDHPKLAPAVACRYDGGDRLTTCTHVLTPEERAALEEPERLAFACEHESHKGVFRLPWPDGKVEVFRDRPARYLVLEPDPETGRMRPVVRRGCPTYLYLAREEREIR